GRQEQAILRGVNVEPARLLKLRQQLAVLERLLFDVVVILKKRPIVRHDSGSFLLAGGSRQRFTTS
ncbi:hypothetical protein LYZ86_22835, partial [Xanthomonas hortorum pv. cynarae]|nr:hypothetical protein [Xanthomonas hortorum pv. cynarae]